MDVFSSSIQCLGRLEHNTTSMTAREIYFILMGTNTVLSECGTPNLDIAHVKRRLLHCSRGLIEVISTKRAGLLNREGLIVQFIHETVRSFLLQSSISGPALFPAGTPRFDVAELQAAQGHSVIAKYCLQYISGLGNSDFFWEKITRSEHPLASYHPLGQVRREFLVATCTPGRYL